MSEDRKYKQRGYQDNDNQRESRASGGGMPRMPVITAYKETVRCDMCGTDLATFLDVKDDSQCPKCEAALHTCRNCHYFDPSAHYECAQPIKKKISRKAKANTCTFFKIRTISVKDIGGPGPAGATAATTKTDDARKALEDLFKK